MVTQVGMSDKLGPRLFGKREEMVFLGRNLGEHRDYGPRTEELIDEEVDALLQAGWDNAERILTEKTEQLHAISKFLIEHETIDGKQMTEIVEGRDPLATVEPEPKPEPPAEAGEAESPPSPAPENQGRAPDIRDASPQPGLG